MSSKVKSVTFHANYSNTNDVKQTQWNITIQHYNWIVEDKDGEKYISREIFFVSLQTYASYPYVLV